MFQPQAIASNLKKIRSAKGLSQHGLAAALGVSPQTVSKWECGRGIPDIENLCLLSEILGVSVDTLLGGASVGRKVMIGIDGGGSKTEFILFSEDGAILGRTMRGGCSPTIIGLEACAELLSDGIRELMLVHSGVSAIFIGGAGCYTDHNGEKIKALLQKSYPQIKMECRSDIMNVILAASDGQDCVAAICGTGVSAFVYKDDNLRLFTGWGYMLDRYGSGYCIGRDALSAVLEASVGLGEPTALSQAVTKKLGKTAEQAIGELYRGGVSAVAAFAPCVFAAYEEKDAVAERILRKNAAYLASVITKAAADGACRRVIVSGGLITANEKYAAMVREGLPPSLSMIVGRLPQCIGSCIGAARLVGLEGGVLRESLLAAYQKEFES